MVLTQEQKDERIRQICLQAELELQRADQEERDLEAERILRECDQGASKQQAAAARAEAILNCTNFSVEVTKAKTHEMHATSDHYVAAMPGLMHRIFGEGA